jgi:hypothetical protein
MTTKNIAIEAYRIPEKTGEASFDAVGIGEGHIKEMDTGSFSGLLIMNGIDISPSEKEKLHDSRTITAYADSPDEVMKLMTVELKEIFGKTSQIYEAPNT